MPVITCPEPTSLLKGGTRPRHPLLYIPGPVDLVIDPPRFLRLLFLNSLIFFHSLGFGPYARLGRQVTQIFLRQPWQHVLHGIFNALLCWVIKDEPQFLKGPATVISDSLFKPHISGVEKPYLSFASDRQREQSTRATRFRAAYQKSML